MATIARPTANDISASQLSAWPVDLSAANAVQLLPLPDSDRAINHSLLLLRETMGRRVRIRIGVETLVTWRGNGAYKRLRGTSIGLSAPNAEQAQIFIDALRSFAASLDGKWLAPPPQDGQPAGPPTPGTK